ncbi:N-alpha-acetyltransferase auxiliary subunit [Brachionus plicatilis]|uniref:N-alpha-acetyltransferase auxiliary subunit n=1 Tax=Brachionus plicatilis TaxID=10195 RepID=A0A3M7RK71_BRAPC|nr:N-alpha-acetyltransferase auxiliary subunit [Brachionus plicatilis]
MPSSNPLPSHEANLFKKILKCYEQKQYRKALQHVKEILKKFPDHGETLSMKGLILNYTNKKSEAFECAQRGLKNDVKSHVCWHVYGLLQRSDRKYDEAIKCYRNALKLDPANLQILRDLSLLQIQIRDLEGFRDTRYQLLQLRPTQRVSWIGYAMSYHLLKDHSIANNILEEFNKTQPKTIDFEMSELLLYQNKIYQEAKLFEKSIKHLDDNKNFILDKLCLLEKKAFALTNLNKNEEAAKIYEQLIERNPDNLIYYQNLEASLNLNSIDEKLNFYAKLSEKYPRSDIPRKTPLLFLSDSKQFSSYVEEYLKRSFRKGITPLFKEIKCLYSEETKWKIIESLVVGYATCLETDNKFSNDSSQEEPPTCLLWVYYFLAQHFDYLKQYAKALVFINKAINHTPTLVELYIVKGKIYKHCGKVYDAVVCLDEAQSLDTADRFVNYKCSKYMLRASMIKEAEEIAAKFTRETSHPAEYLKEMQCMWYEIEAANAYRRIGKFGDALKKCHQVERHFQEFIEDQFDFHSYCMRKMTLSSYVDMLRLEDRIKSHPFFYKASKIAIEIYLRLNDNPLKEMGAELDTNTENLSPAELKKLKNKQKKQQLKAQNEKEKQQQLEQKRKELNKQKNKEDSDLEQPIEEELLPEKLERPENPLEECNRFLKPIEEFAAQYPETHYLAFQVYYRKNKPLLMMKALKKIKKNSNTVDYLAKFHYCACKFLLKYEKEKCSYNTDVLGVIQNELKHLELFGQSVEKLNENFLSVNQNNFESLIVGSKILYDLNPNENQQKALDLFKNISKENLSINLITAIDAFRSVAENHYFGKCSKEEVENIRTKLKEFFTEATIFKTPEEQANDLINCVQGLSINSFVSSVNNDITDQMTSVNIR